MSKPWVPPLIVFALVLFIVGGFLAGGPQFGLIVGTGAVAALVLMAARAVDKGHIETMVAPDMRRRVLVVLGAELDDAAVARIAEEGEFDRPGNRADVLLLAPAWLSRLDRWAVDVERSRSEAQRRLVVSAAALGKAGLQSKSVVGDPDPILAVEDTLRSFAASEVVLVESSPDEDHDMDRFAAELEERLRQPLSRIVT